MFNRTNLLIVLVAIIGAGLGLFAGSRFGQPPERPLPPGVTALKPGDLRTDLTLEGIDGKPHRLSEWDGKLVLVNFWATWCGPCRDEMPLLDHVRHQHEGLEVIGVAIDDSAAVAAYLKDNPVRYPILLGGEAPDNASVLFGDTQSVLPYSVLLGRDGRIVAQRAGSFTAASLASWLDAHR